MKALVVAAIVIALFWIVLGGIAAGLFSKSFNDGFTTDHSEIMEQHCEEYDC